MKRKEFATLRSVDGHVIAVYVKGYTDGVFNYYKVGKRNYWHAVHPLTGMSVAFEYTRTSAQWRALSDDVQRFIDGQMKLHGDFYIQCFSNALSALDESNKI